MPDTYLDHCLKDGRLVRWPDRAMPIKVHIAPFRWYERSKMQESTAYNQMVLNAMQRWSQVSNRSVRFKVVPTVDESQIDLNWRRVDRTSLGHCEYMVSKENLLYSAEIRIGISDGRIHQKYNNTDEVQHTITHEFGHALGLLGHSTASNDIMYVPHQFGVVDVSKRDIDTLRWLYKLPPSFDFLTVGRKYRLPEPFTIHDVINKMAGVSGNSGAKASVENSSEYSAASTSKPFRENPKVLTRQQDLLTEMGKFHMATQHIRVHPSTESPILRPKPRQGGKN